MLPVVGIDVGESADTLEEDVEVEALVLGVEVQTKGPFRCAVTDIGTVVGGNLAIAVDIYEAQITGNGIRLDEGAVGILVGIDLVNSLEDAGRLVAVEEREGLSVLCTCATIREL